MHAPNATLLVVLVSVVPLAWAPEGPAQVPDSLRRSAAPPPRAPVVSPIRARPLQLSGLARVCRPGELVPDPVVARVSAILSAGDPGPDTDGVLDALETDARRSLGTAPGDAEARYRLVVILGARTDRADGRAQLGLAEELHREVRALLQLEPSHAGAHHVLGRLHAAVMRIGGLERFLARHLVGGAVLDEASWERARHHLERAEAGDPCIPEHHYELGRVHMERGDVPRAWEEIGHVLALTAHERARWSDLRRKAESLADGN